MKLTRPLAVFDIESTGLNVTQDRIVEIAVVRIEMDGTRTRRVRRINPERPIPPEVTLVHGITDADVANEPTFRQVAKGLHQLLKDCDIGGYNAAAFDVPMLHEEFARAGIVWDVDLARILDAGVIFKVMEQRTLAAAMIFYCGQELVGAHGAMADTEATADVIEAQIGRYARFQSDDAEAQLFAASRYDGPPAADVGGKLTRDADGDLVYTFGKSKGIKIRNDIGYARWMLKGDFPTHTKWLLQEELDRIQAR